MRFIKLSDAELTALNDGHRNGKQFLFRNRCQSLILSHQGYTIAQLMKLFNIHRVTVYARFDLWESGGIQALHKKPGQGRRPKLSPANPKHVEVVRAAVEGERQNLKAVVAQLSAELEIQMHPDTLKRFLKNSAILSAVSANASRAGKTRNCMPKAK